MTGNPPRTYTQLPDTQPIITPLLRAAQVQSGYVGAGDGNAALSSERGTISIVENRTPKHLRRKL